MPKLLGPWSEPPEGSPKRWNYAPLTGARRRASQPAKLLGEPNEIVVRVDYGLDIPLWGDWESLELPSALLERLVSWQKDFDENFHYKKGWSSSRSRDQWVATAGQLLEDLRTVVNGRVDVRMDLWPASR